MALFNFGKKKKEKKPAESTEKVEKKEVDKKAPAPAPTKKVTPQGDTSEHNISRILLQPRITEKATLGIERGAYVFDVAPDANKRQVMQAVQKVYNVQPVKVHMTKIPSKDVRNMRTGIKGVKSGGKKAYVYLKKGETISIL